MRQSTFLAHFLIILFWFFLYVFLLYIPYLSHFFSRPQTITILTWAEMIDPQLVALFEKETGITVKLRYFENNEELFAKLIANKGKGFDAIIPSDYIIEKLIEQNLVKPIEKSKLSFFENIDKKFLHHYYDPENKYSIPYNWSIYGIGINKNYVHETAQDWGLVFNPIDNIKIQMPNSAKESFLIAASYLFHKIDALSSDQIQLIEQLLIKQKKWIETYTDTDVRAEYLLVSDICPLVVVASTFLPNTLNQYPHLDFLIPQPKTFIIIDNILISSATKNDSLVYQFINFLFVKDNLKHHMLKYPFMPTTNQVWDWLEELSPRLFKIITQSKSELEFFRNTIPESLLQILWLRVKVA